MLSNQVTNHPQFFDPRFLSHDIHTKRTRYFTAQKKDPHKTALAYFTAQKKDPRKTAFTDISTMMAHREIFHPSPTTDHRMMMLADASTSSIGLLYQHTIGEETNIEVASQPAQYEKETTSWPTSWIGLLYQQTFGEETNVEVASQPAQYGEETSSLLPWDFEPSPYSVIFGQGKGCTESVGNRRLKVIASTYLCLYAKALSQDDKSKVVSEVQSIIQAACCPNQRGAFIRKCPNGSW
jgi:hypothetical protein